jgi:hypothetical protein
MRGILWKKAPRKMHQEQRKLEKKGHRAKIQFRVDCVLEYMNSRHGNEMLRRMRQDLLESCSSRMFLHDRTGLVACYDIKRVTLEEVNYTK